LQPDGRVAGNRDRMPRPPPPRGRVRRGTGLALRTDDRRPRRARPRAVPRRLLQAAGRRPGLHYPRSLPPLRLRLHPRVRSAGPPLPRREPPPQARGSSLPPRRLRPRRGARQSPLCRLPGLARRPWTGGGILKGFPTGGRRQFHGFSPEQLSVIFTGPPKGIGPVMENLQVDRELGGVPEGTARMAVERAASISPGTWSDPGVTPGQFRVSARIT